MWMLRLIWDFFLVLFLHAVFSFGVCVWGGGEYYSTLLVGLLRSKIEDDTIGRPSYLIYYCHISHYLGKMQVLFS